MYLTKKLHVYGKARGSEKVHLGYLMNTVKDENDDKGPLVDLSKVSEISLEAAYWRKSNQIHKWFVDNVQDGEDNCEEYYVDREQLQELVDLCKQVLADHSKAEELLPGQEGFFFGGTEYDEWYFQDIEHTVEMLEELLSNPENDDYEFYYQSSW